MIRPYRLFKKVVDNCFLSINYPNICSCQILNYKDVTVIRKKKVKPKFIVWKGIKVIELAKSMNKNIDDIMEVICRVLGDNTRLRYSTAINDISLLREVAKLCGGTIMEKFVVVQKEEEDKNVYRRNVFANSEKLKPRPPVVTIMGHVDHGKTTLLDSLRSSRIVDSEHGGITQHLSAFKVSLSDVSRESGNGKTGEVVTFLDTPGHAAFSAMRSRGANCTDIIVLVVAIEDGIMPQTIESIEFAKEANVPVIVAVNKIDKFWKDLKHFDSDKNKKALEPIKRYLANHDLVVEEYGGDVQMVPISAKKKWNLDLLQESILVLAEIINIRSDYEGPVESVVLEANVIEDFGKVATILIQHGCLKHGQILVAGNTYAKVRTITSDKGDFIKEAYPGDPVQVTGWKDTLPSSGDIVIQVDTESRAKEVLTYRKRKLDKIRSEADMAEYNRYMSEYKASYRSFIEKGYRQGFRKRSERPQLVDFVSHKNTIDGVEIPQINIILKVDVHGSLEAILEVLKKVAESCDNQCVLKVIHSGIGSLTETDIELAVGFGAIIYIFNLPKTASQSEVDIRYFNVIYHLFDDLKEYVASKLPEITEVEFVGEAEVKKTFDISENNSSISVSGCKCTSGILYRNETYIYKIVQPSFQSNEFQVLHENLVCRNLRHLKSDVETIRKGIECGIILTNRQTGAIVTSDVGNVIQCYKIKYAKQKLTWDMGF